MTLAKQIADKIDFLKKYHNVDVFNEKQFKKIGDLIDSIDGELSYAKRAIDDAEYQLNELRDLFDELNPQHENDIFDDDDLNYLLKQAENGKE